MNAILSTTRAKLQLVYSTRSHIKLRDDSFGKLQNELMNFKLESGRRLRQAREAKRWTLNDLSNRLTGMSASRISNYEQGIRLMRQPEAVQLAGPLGVTAAYLMCVDEQIQLPTKIQRLIDHYEQADLRGRRTIEQIAESQALMNNHASVPYLQPLRNPQDFRQS